MSSFPAVQKGQRTEIPVDIVGGTKFSRYPKETVETSINLMVTGAEIGEAALVNFLGYEEVIADLSGQARGGFVSTIDNAMYVVYGTQLIRINSSLTYTVVGILNTQEGEVFISENGNSELGIVDGEVLYVYNYANFTLNVPLLDFKPLYITYQDTYLILTGDDYNWHLSGSNNALVWDPLLRQAIQTQADTIVAAVRLNRQLWIIGEKVSELWYDQGRVDFPFARDNSIAIDYGAVNRSTIAEGFGMLVWLSQNDNASPAIVYTTGGDPQTVSTDGLDFKLNQLTSISTSYGFLYQEDGHIFYHLVFPSDNFSFVYDFTSKLYYTITDECLDYHVARLILLFNNKLYMLNINNSNIYETSTSFTTYAGETIPRIRITSSIRAANDDVFIVSNLKLQLEQGINPELSRIDLSVSRDGGYSFGNTVSHQMKPLGRRPNQLRFWRLGRANDFTPQFRFWSPGRIVIKNCTAEVTR